MLTQQLRELEKDGLVIREQFNEIPPRVEYLLSKIGLSLKPIFLSTAETVEKP
jgi:DNA-binding HxlR family transcriptional regulator